MFIVKNKENDTNYLLPNNSCITNSNVGNVTTGKVAILSKEIEKGKILQNQRVGYFQEKY